MAFYAHWTEEVEQTMTTRYKIHGTTHPPHGHAQLGMNYLVGHAVFSQTQKRLQIKSYSTEKARAPVAEEREGEKGIGKRERYQVRQSMHPFTPPFTLLLAIQYVDYN